MTDRIFRRDGQGAPLVYIGDFNGLYMDDPDPWDQSGAPGPMASYYAFSRNRLVQALKRHNGHGSGVEIGCGNGHVLQRLEREIPTVAWGGVDIVPAAVANARALCENSAHRIYCLDICRDLASWEVWSPRADVVILSQCLWYVLQDFDLALSHIATMMKPGGTFIITQAFLPQQEWGRNLCDGFAGCVKLMHNRVGFELIEALYDGSGAHSHNDGLLIYRRR